MRVGIAIFVSIFLAGTVRAEEWLQRYHDPQHSSFIAEPVDPLNRVTFNYIFDPTQVSVGSADILVHYTDPKLKSNGDMIFPFRDQIGTTPTYSVKKIRGNRVLWTFTSDYIRAPSTWEPVFDYAIGNGVVYAMGAFGCAWLLDETSGSIVTRVCSYTLPEDPTGLPIFVSSPFTIDASGNVFWTIRAGTNPLGVRSSIVKLAPDGSVVSAAFEDLTGDANQIAALNSPPALSADGGTIYTASTLANQTGGRLLAMDQGFNVLWNASLRVDIPASEPGGPCHEARLNDNGTSSPVALPDGGAAIGGWSSPTSPGCTAAECPVSEGFYYSFNSSGTFRGCYQFGWDDTMGVMSLNGSTYLVGKHNHYTATPTPYFEVVVLDATTMQKVYSVCQPSTAAACNQPERNIFPISNDTTEWCIDAPTLYKTVDSTGNEVGHVVVPSEAGKLFNFTVFSNPVEETHQTVGGFQSAAYVPTVSIGGTALTINHGRIVGVSR